MREMSKKNNPLQLTVKFVFEEISGALFFYVLYTTLLSIHSLLANLVLIFGIVILIGFPFFFFNLIPSFESIKN